MYEGKDRGVGSIAFSVPQGCSVEREVILEPSRGPMLLLALFALHALLVPVSVKECENLDNDEEPDQEDLELPAGQEANNLPRGVGPTKAGEPFLIQEPDSRGPGGQEEGEKTTARAGKMQLEQEQGLKEKRQALEERELAQPDRAGHQSPTCGVQQQ
ncbi:hypothetical protein NDU88_003308 [Pleurodeles waltl]|uniref:Uncharacterized protein n=1 Tax=Pleurodeles waltl TaxID=8319 RepID=A0AAV7WUF1_PLEWA|nr:hypothetical protein NDU88_003308 [Pleurodeles waltl]